MIPIETPRQPGEQEYRCTLPELYPKGCDGHTDPSKRLGYYVFAADEEKARELMHRMFPRAKAVEVERFVLKGAKA